MARRKVLDTKRASWGGLLRKAACIGCGEVCWFDGTLFLCQDCREDPDSKRVRMPLIPNSTKLRPPSDNDE